MAARKWKRAHCYNFSSEYFLLLSDFEITEIINFQKLKLCFKVAPNLYSMKAKICLTSA